MAAFDIRIDEDSVYEAVQFADCGYVSDDPATEQFRITADLDEQGAGIFYYGKYEEIPHLIKALEKFQEMFLESS